MTSMLTISPENAVLIGWSDGIAVGSSSFITAVSERFDKKIKHAQGKQSISIICLRHVASSHPHGLVTHVLTNA